MTPVEVAEEALVIVGKCIDTYQYGNNQWSQDDMLTILRSDIQIELEKLRTLVTTKVETL